MPNESLEVKCEDFLKDNSYVYARKAKRKKIALVRISAANNGAAAARIELGATKLVVGERSYAAESPDVIVRKFSEFTWDFVLYSILDFHPLLAVVDFVMFLSGPIYNRRLKRQLQLLSAGELVILPGETKQAIIGFRGVSLGAGKLQLWYRCGEGERERLDCGIG